MRKLAVLLLLCGTTVRELHACAPAPRAGDSIAIVEESAAIVWDPAAKTQHFIRRATFSGDGRDFGFLVPTPSVPALKEVDDEIFDHLEEWTKPETVHVERRRIDWSPLFAISNKGEGNAATTAAGVNVLSTMKIAGYEAAVLEAASGGELQEWLNKHGYATTPDLAEWLNAYVEKRWIITAFKIDPEQGAIARSSAVKMSFTTDRPFFPYREPASLRHSEPATYENRVLNVWFIGPERVSGTIGESGTWPAQLRRSETLPEAHRAELSRLSGVPLGAGSRFTAFYDRESPRPGVDDLFFTRAADQSTVVPPPNVIETVHETRVPADILAAVALGAVFLGWRRRRRKRAVPPNIDASGTVH